MSNIQILYMLLAKQEFYQYTGTVKKNTNEDDDLNQNQCNDSIIYLNQLGHGNQSNLYS